MPDGTYRYRRHVPDGTYRYRRHAWVKFLATATASASVGYWAGAQEPVSAVGHLEFPRLVRNHRGDTLILFLHGWRGDARDSWKFYPHLVCGDLDFADADVLSIAYPTYVIQGNLTMEQLGSWIADRLAANDVGRYARVVIVAHSIGGLVARRVVLEQRPELKNIVFLLEIATPHTGPADYTLLVKQVGLKGGKLVGELKPGVGVPHQAQGELAGSSAEAAHVLHREPARLGGLDRKRPRRLHRAALHALVRPPRPGQAGEHP